jgi:uncharacterized protein (TIGR02246 family)
MVRRTASGDGEEAHNEVIRRLTAASLLLLAVSLVAEPAKKRVFNREEAMIRRMPTRFAETWNAHAMEAMAELFTEDADFVTVGGIRLKGRARIRDEHAKRHEMQFKESVMTVRSVDVRFLKPDVALVHVDWGMERDRDPDGTSRSPRNGVMSWVVVRQRDEWRIASAHNTNARETSTNP